MKKYKHRLKMAQLIQSISLFFIFINILNKQEALQGFKFKDRLLVFTRADTFKPYQIRVSYMIDDDTSYISIYKILR